MKTDEMHDLLENMLEEHAKKRKAFQKIIDEEDVLAALFFLRERASTIQCNEILRMLINKFRREGRNKK